MAYRFDPDYEAAAIAKTRKEPLLQTNRSVWKLLILNILTLGIYKIVFFIPFAFDLDRVAPKRYGGKTFNYLFAYILAFFTANIVIWVWFYHITERVLEALETRDIECSFQMSDFWIWAVLGSFVWIGQYVYLYKLCKAMNLLCEDYNRTNQVKTA